MESQIGVNVTVPLYKLELVAVDKAYVIALEHVLALATRVTQLGPHADANETGRLRVELKDSIDHANRIVAERL